MNLGKTYLLSAPQYCSSLLYVRICSSTQEPLTALLSQLLQLVGISIHSNKREKKRTNMTKKLALGLSLTVQCIIVGFSAKSLVKTNHSSCPKLVCISKNLKN